MNVPLYTYLKLILIVLTFTWITVCLRDFFWKRTWSVIKVSLHALTWSLLTLYLVFYGLTLQRFPLTHAAESLLFIAWVLLGSFLLRNLPPPQRSLDIFLIPIPSMFIVVGMSSVDHFNAIILLSKSPLAQLNETLILFSITLYFYALIIAALYERSFREIKHKTNLVLALKLPSLSSLKTSMERFLLLGSLIFLCLVSIHFILLPTAIISSTFAPMPLHFIYTSSGILFLCLFILTQLNRINHTTLLIGMSCGFILILLYLFNIF